MSYQREVTQKSDFRTKTMSFKATEKEDQIIKAEVKRRKMKSISEYLAYCCFLHIGEKL